MTSLFKEMVYREIDSDSVIFYEGDEGEWFYIIIDGEAEVYKEKV